MDIHAIVVDDDAASAQAIAQLLVQAACRVTVCTDPESAIAIALKAGVDVVSLDITMPRLDGFEVLSLIRSHEHSRRAPSVPVIAITGSISSEDKAHALASGFAAHLGKPVALQDLKLVLGRVQTLRGDLYRTRYTVDQEAIVGRLDHLLSVSSSEASPAVAGLALAIEQQGTELLRQMLGSAYARDFEDAAEAALRLADVGEALGADHFASLCASFVASLGAGVPLFELQTVLVRAELDRIVYTLRERVLP